LNIDWFTFVAQVINFLILVALLKHFLYGPIIKAMEKRQQKIAARMNEAEKKKKEAQEEREAYSRKNAEFEQKRQEMISSAKQESEEVRRDLIEKARHEVNEQKSRWIEAIEREKESFLKNLQQKTGDEVCRIARKALKDLANVELEKQVVSIFIERLKNLDEEEQKKLVSTMKDEEKPVVIQSAFKFPDDLKDKMTKTLQDLSENNIKVEYKSNENLVCGIELKIHGHKLAWNLDSYLEGIRESISGYLREVQRRGEEEESEE